MVEAAEGSTADAAELVWTESLRFRGLRRRNQSAGGSDESRGGYQSSLAVRARGGRRWGAFRQPSPSAAEAADSLRAALANARLNPPEPVPRDLPAALTADEKHEISGLFDPTLAGLRDQAGLDLLDELLTADEIGRLEWGQERVVVVNSRGLRRRAAVTHVSLEARSGDSTTGGWARGSCRKLNQSALLEVVERARRRDSGTGAVAPPTTLGEGPILFSPEAAGILLDSLNGAALTAQAFDDPGPKDHWVGNQVFGTVISLRDDGQDRRGLPFPFDLTGRTKEAIELVQQGVVRTPAVTPRVGQRLGLATTAHFIDPSLSQAAHLFLTPGTDDGAAMLAAADGGLWVTRLDHLIFDDPAEPYVRAIARGVRVIRDGRLAEPLPDLEWHDNLKRVFQQARAVGNRPVRQELRGGMFGGVSAPSLLVAPGASLRLARPGEGGRESDRPPAGGRRQTG